MRKTLLTVFLGLGSLSADTLTLRDGTRVEGTLLSASGTSITFIDSRGARRSYNVSNVEELAFGEASTSRSRTEPELDATRGTDLVARLNEDIGRAMERSTLSSRQRQMLQDARSTLTAAAEDLRENRTIDRRQVRTALDNVRYVMNGSGIQESDRQAVLDDIQQLRGQVRELNNNPSR
ncbi:MAG TPA: hypothetical protein VEX68_19320 [Bryobacteraceae bacterium]|nr:hypothetical protein [Bryobacteraceae bacterium]